MIWTDSAADLPAPRDDEPAHLRQDIHDELADHLQSAMERELRQNTNEGTARERVLERFGDPRRVARKLWQDAMWEKLMSQRILIGMAGLMLVACCGMVWITWTIASQGREMNAALLARLERLEQPHVVAPAVNPEWNPASVQLVSESGGPLPAGFKVGFLSKDFQFEQPVDAGGRVNLGLQRPGTCIVGVDSPWGERMRDENMPIRAGEPYAPRIVCPTAPEQIESPLELHWPEGLDSPDIWLACWAWPKARTIAGREWSSSEEKQFFIDHSGRVMFNDAQFESRFDKLNDGGFIHSYDPYGSEHKQVFVGPFKTIPNLALSALYETQVTIVPVRMRDIETKQPTCRQVANPQRQVQLQLDRTAPAHWTLTVPAEVKQEIDKLAERSNSPAVYAAPGAAVAPVAE